MKITGRWNDLGEFLKELSGGTYENRDVIHYFWGGTW